jgi:hypothetical protein
MGKIDLQALKDRLPVTMARTDAPKLLGGIVSSKTLANEDSRGSGPAGRFTLGRKVCYQTEQLLEWLEKKM